MGLGRRDIPEVRISGRCTGRLVTKKEGNYKFFLASDDGVLAADTSGRKVMPS